MTRSTTIFLTFLLMTGLSGCASIGPRTIVRDRVDYVTAISDSWKSQTLLNLVKMRYGDAPVFLNVDSAINQYSVDSSVSLSSTWFVNPFEEHSSEQGLSALGGYSDKPTITYTPLSGEQFARNLMAPIPPAAILNLLQAGYPADVVLRACVHAISRAAADPDIQLPHAAARRLCRRALSPEMVLDRRQGFSFQGVFFVYHVSLHANGDRR